MSSKYSFQKRWQSLISFDEIRKYKLIEIIEYTILFFVVNMVVSNILNNLYFDRVNVEERKQKISNNNPFEILNFILTLILETVIITIIIFYMRKIVLLVPSYGSIKSDVFEPNTALEYTVHIALVFVFLEMIPTFKEQYTILGHLLQNK